MMHIAVRNGDHFFLRGVSACNVEGLARMLVIRDYGGAPCPPHGPPLCARTGDVIELMFADLHSSWWQVRASLRVQCLTPLFGEGETCHGADLARTRRPLQSRLV